MRVGLTPIGGTDWPGGRHYLLNLISSLLLLPKAVVEPVIFVGPDISKAELDDLTMGGQVASERAKRWSRGTSRRLVTALRSVLIGRDSQAEASFRRAGVEVVLQHNDFYGKRFAVPCVAWIPDFQHRRMPEMFSPANRARRELGYRALTSTASMVLLSSESARADCERYYPRARGKTAVAHFAVRVGHETLTRGVSDCLARYALPARYLYMPNQFWKHKNHLAIVEAMRILSGRNVNAVLVLSGAQSDARHPGHADRVLGRIRDYGLAKNVRVLGIVPYEDVVTLMRGCLALVNPSLSEGWSTTVEEAKLLGVPLVLSNLDVHREQAGATARYFDPFSVEEIAEAIGRAYESDPHPATGRPAAEVISLMEQRQMEFARKFVDIARSAVSN